MIGVKGFESGASHPKWSGDTPTYSALHRRLGRVLNDDECWACGTTTGPFFNSCVNPTRWGYNQDGTLLLMGNDVTDYRRMCRSCGTAYDQRIRNEALAMFFGVPLPCS
jgi:hypothetical protein